MFIFFLLEIIVEIVERRKNKEENEAACWLLAQDRGIWQVGKSWPQGNTAWEQIRADLFFH